MKLLCLLSGGIDSPVAAYLMKKKGHSVSCIHFQIGKAEKVKKLAKKIGCNLVIKQHALALKKIQKLCEPKLTCVLCKRTMLSKAADYAVKNKFDGLLTGDNLGQVASQTIDNLVAETKIVKIPIIRPLIGFNKNEIITIAKKIGTYDLSITDAHTCPFVPDKPATHADLEKVEIEWKKLR